MENINGDYFKDCKMFVGELGSTLAIKPNGNIVGFCSKINPNGEHDYLVAFIDFAVENGGFKIRSYDGDYGFYRYCGFEPVSWCKFNPELEDKWKQAKQELEKQGETLKEEHIIFYKYTGKESKYKIVEDFYNNVSASKDYTEAEKVRDESIGENPIQNTAMMETKEELDKILKRAHLMKGYPMTYDEFENKVIELYLKMGEGNEEWSKRQQELLELLKYENSTIIPAEYLYACHVYDTQNINTFTDFQLESQPVRILDMLT